MWSFSVLQGRLWVAPGGVELRPWRSQEVRGSPELQNSGLRALEEAWGDFLIEALKAGAKSSTRLPPGKLVEHFETKCPRLPASSLQPPALCLQPSACSRQSPALRHGHAPEAQKTTRLDRKMPQSRSGHPGIFQSSQATVLELWASPELLGPPGTQLDTSWGHFDAGKVSGANADI